MPIDDTRLIHIVGMYKCGTSWLAHILAAHPEVIGWREFDIVRAVYGNQVAAPHTRLYNRVLKALGLPPRQPLQQKLALREKDEVMRQLFCGQGWVPIMDAEKRATAQRLDYSDSEAFLDKLMELGGYSLQLDGAPLLSPARFDNTLGVVNCRRGDLRQFVEAVRDSANVASAPLHYFEFLQNQCEPGVPIALKAADQIMCIDKLQHYSPRSRKIVIIRDGRDAAISAVHYDKLMTKWGAPWQPQQLGFHDRLRAWCTRAGALAAYARKYDILVLRYEDLQRSFQPVCTRLFQRLGIDASADVVAKVHERTHFSSVAGGRKPGEAAESVVRKGVIGEWKSTLDSGDAASAWRAAHRQLHAFGYTENGSYQQSPLCSIIAG